jgi:hypothetical protein
MPNNRIRIPCISIVSPSITDARPLSICGSTGGLITIGNLVADLAGCLAGKYLEYATMPIATKRPAISIH